jgi:hypothetical protein
VTLTGEEVEKITDALKAGKDYSQGKAVMGGTITIKEALSILAGKVKPDPLAGTPDGLVS